MRASPFSVALAAGIVGLDALSKLWARSVLGGQTVPLLPGLVLHVTENPRGPFGLGPLWLAAVASIVVLVLLLGSDKHLVFAARKHQVFALASLAGGGLANLGERLLFGRTTDLLVLGNLTALNVADIAILSGILALLIPRGAARTPSPFRPESAA